MAKFLGDLTALCILVTVFLLVLKLLGIIAWAWVWIFSPILFLLAVLGILVIYLAFKCGV